MKYRREIDGLRALAVIPVILFHSGFQAFSGGYIGVDVFFVISGYLITSILIAEMDTGSFSLVQFYERRARRILPALFFVMAVCLPFAWFWLLPQDMRAFSNSLVAVITFSSNILFWLQSGYFETSAELKPLLHTWSLAVEEQFYVFFPLFLMLAWRVGKRNVAAILACLFLLSLGLAQWGAFNKPGATFFLLPTRGWELLIGCFIAFYLQNKNAVFCHRHIAQGLSVIGLFFILYAVFMFDKNTPFPSLYALVPTIGTGLIILFASPATFVGSLLGNKAVVGIGLISYSAYLWHNPLFAFARHRSLEEPSKVLLGLLAVVALLLAYLSWKYVEAPFRDKKKFSRTQIFKYSVVGSAFFLAFGLTGLVSNGFQSRLTIEQQALDEYANYPNSIVNTQPRCHLGTDQIFSELPKECSPTTKNKNLLIWGDSHAGALAFGFRNELVDVLQFTSNGCPPIRDLIISLRPNCKEVNDFFMNEINRLKPSRIIIHANWTRYREHTLVGSIQRTVQHVRNISPDSVITLVGSVPQWRPSLPSYMIKTKVGLNGENYLPNASIAELNEYDENIRQAANLNKVRFVSALAIFCKSNECLVKTPYKGNVMLTTWDYGHLTEAGSVYLARRLLESDGNQR
jgi:peptidoglycan/LPS O-acetylase OafA/YrhL